MKEKESEEQGDDTNSNVSGCPGFQILVPWTLGLGPHFLPPGAAPNDPVDPIPRPWTSSAGPIATPH